MGRTCKKCGDTKPLVNFPLVGGGKYRRHECKACRLKYETAWNRRNGWKGKNTNRKKRAARHAQTASFKESQRRYNRKNRAWRLETTTRRRLTVKQQTPGWADLKVMQAIYREARAISQETGIIMHVDHIIPIRGKNVCGLHCEDNLRIVPATVNVRKLNKLLEAA